MLSLVTEAAPLPPALTTQRYFVPFASVVEAKTAFTVSLSPSTAKWSPTVTSCQSSPPAAARCHR